MSDEALVCDGCDRTVTRDDALRQESYGDLDSESWQTLCCPDCGARLRTVYVGDHDR